MVNVGTDDRVDGGGVALGAAAYVLWGLFPAFWPLLEPGGAVEILAHRVAWTMLLMAAVLVVTKGWSLVATLTWRGWLIVAASSVAITLNWGVFIYGATNAHVVEIALGYFMSPLVSVLLGVLVLKERLRTWQWVAIGLAVAGVVVLTALSGGPPWLALVLAVSFGIYGLLKKKVPLPATASLTAEGLVMGPLAVVYLIWLEAAGQGTFVSHGGWHAALLILGGPVTAAPLLLFGAAARRIPLATIGTLMYLTPTLQFLWGYVVAHEPMSGPRWIGFALVWAALLLFTLDLWRSNRRPPDPAIQV